MNKISTFEVLPWRPDLYDESNKIVLTHLHLYTKVYHPKSLDVQVIIISEISLKHSFFVLGPQTEVLNENRTLSFSTFSKCTSLFIRSMKTVKKTCIYKRLGFINPLVRTWNDGWQSDTRLTHFIQMLLVYKSLVSWSLTVSEIWWEQTLKKRKLIEIFQVSERK